MISNLHDAIIRRLRQDATLTTLLAAHPYAGSPTVPAVLEFVAQPGAAESDSGFPYVVVGDTTSAEWDTDETIGEDSTLTLHVWDRYEGGHRVRQVIEAIKDSLHRAELSVEGQNVVLCNWEFSESVPDPDPETQHGVTRFRVVTLEG